MAAPGVRPGQREQLSHPTQHHTLRDSRSASQAPGRSSRVFALSFTLNILRALRMEWRVLYYSESRGFAEAASGWLRLRAHRDAASKATEWTLSRQT